MVCATERRDWALFADWCASWGRDPAAADRSTVDEFLAAFPVAPKTQVNRDRAIRNELRRLGRTLEPRMPGKPTAQSLIRTGARYAPVDVALTQLPRTRRVTGLRGRRDAWLLVLIGVLRLTRRETQAIAADDVDLSAGIRVRGQFVPTGPDPLTCPACAVTRWLRVAGVYGVGFRTYAFELVDPESALTDEHDCETPVDDEWLSAPQLLPAIDQHGWFRDAPLSMRSISAISARVQVRTGAVAQAWEPFEATGRFKDATSAELVEAQDAVDARAAELLQRSKALLGDMAGLLDGIGG